MFTLALLMNQTTTRIFDWNCHCVIWWWNGHKVCEQLFEQYFMSFYTKCMARCNEILMVDDFNLPSLFAVWHFWTFHNKSHNIKELVILCHSCHHFFYLPVCVDKKYFCRSLCPSGIFSWERTPSRLPMQITWPCLPVGRFSHGLITIRQKKMLLNLYESLIIDILLSTCQWVHMALAINRLDILLM